MMTGRHASEIGAWDNGALLPADQVTFAHYLSNAGYDTVLSGKMHFVGPGQLHGFQRRLTTDIYSCHFDWVKPEWIRIKETQGRDCEQVMDNRSTHNAQGYTGDSVRVGGWHNALSYDEEVHFRSVEYLRSVAHKSDDVPFMLCASYHHPHEPFLPPQEYWDLYEGTEIEIPEFPADPDKTYSLLDRNLNAYHGTRHCNLRDADGLRRHRRAYYGLVTYIDDKVGELLDVLQETGLADNTLVVFASDHGDMLCEKEMENGTEDRYIFAQAHEAVGVPCIMVRQGHFKYNYIHGNEDQLFDLETDPGEWNNLLDDARHGEIAAALRGKILQRFDPERMADENLESLYRRWYIRDVMKANGTHWNHSPPLRRS